ncbi:MAG: EAL domain-containing protein [Rhodocyclaceae bacterium]|nr:EAL domain-containing protein [Rhodocyclaceae bacterium]
MSDRTLRRRLWQAFILIAVLPLLGLSWLYVASFERALTASVLQTVSSIADKKADEIDDFIDERLVDARIASQHEFLPHAVAELSEAFRRGGLPAARAVELRYKGWLTELAELSHHGRYHDLLLIDAHGNVVLSLIREADLGTNLNDGPYRDSGLAAGYRQAMRLLHADLTPFRPYAPSGDRLATFVVAPILADGRPVGALALQLNVDAFSDVLVDRTGLGRTGDIVLARQEGDEVVFAAPHLLRTWDARWPDHLPLARTPEPLRRALAGEHDRGVTVDYAGQAVAAAWRYLPALHWGMTVKIDADEAFAPAHHVRRLAALTLAAFLCFSTAAGLLLGRRVIRTEERLRGSNEQLNEAQRIARLGSWTLDLKSGRLQCSDEVFRIFEMERAQFGATYEAFLDLVHPEDRERVRQSYDESLRQRMPLRISHRLRMADGRVKHVQGNCETLYAGDGTPQLSRGTVQDVTREKAAADTLELYASIFKHSGEEIVVTDSENRIVAVNPAFTRHTGYTLDDVRGENPKVLSSGLTPREVYQTLWACLEESGFWQGELTDRRKDGTVYPKWASISVIRDENGAITHHIASFTDISERKAAEERIHQLAHHDALTGLLNRFSLESRLEQALLSARREGGQLAVMFIDMDHFKLINDTLGHHLGDQLLVEVAHRLSACVRESDIIARLGGDEFVAVLTGLQESMAAAATAGKIVEALSRPYLIEHHVLHTSPSLGIAIFPVDGQGANELMKNADTAMYDAKRRGRGNYQFFTAAMTVAAGERLEIERGLRRALAENRLELHYQPQVSADDGRICGVEALVRWNDPERGFIPPLRFIPIAEETGLIEPLGNWVLQEACWQLAAWRAQGIGGVRMAVNLSAYQLRDPELIERVRAAMDEHGIGEGELELEVTESVAMDNPERAIKRLQALRGLGVNLAIDDFGTGYSSLAYLKLLPIQTLKLDRAFVRDIESDENDAAISAATLALAHTLGLKVVAEGVETEAQRAFLSAHGCDVLQGYLYSKPLPAGEATAFLLRRGRPADAADPV